MRRMRRMVLGVAMMVAASLPVVGLAAQEKPNKYERRLVAAELKEIGEGDLGGAMKAYAFLHADLEAPSGVRARAGLYLARCERKRGRLAAAERLLAALVRDFAEEKQVVKTAQSFLRELRTGKPENPDFDWMGALEKNPEIQARVFKLAMDVADPWSTAGKSARKQLKALGRVAVPMLLKLCTTSREPAHQQSLAVILVQAGSFERLDVLFGGTLPSLNAGGMWELLIAVSQFETADRVRFRAAARSLKPHPAASAWFAAVRLAAGEKDRISDVLRVLEKHGTRNFNLSKNETELLPCNILRARVEREPELESVLLARLEDPKCSAIAADTYLDILGARIFEHFTLDQVIRLLIRIGNVTDIRSYAHEFFARWEKKGTYRPIVALARHKKIHPVLISYLARRYDWKKKPEAVPAGWAKVLRAGGLFADLHRVAERNDDFVPVFEDFMRERAGVAPRFEGHRIVSGEGFHPPSRDPAGIYRGWTPSAAYAAAMLRLLESSDPVTQTLALEALACAPVGVGPDATEPILQLIKRSLEPNAALAHAAIGSLCARFVTRPATGAQVIEAWLAWNRRQRVVAMSAGRANEPVVVIYQRNLRGVLRGRYDCSVLLGGMVPTLFPFALARAETTLGRSLFLSVEKGLENKDVVPVLQRAFGAARDSSQVGALLKVRPTTLRRFLATVAGLAALKRCALDRQQDPSDRMAAYSLGWPASEAWIDWTAAVGEEPEFAAFAVRRGQFHNWFFKQTVPSQERFLKEAFKKLPAAARASLVEYNLDQLGSQRYAFLRAAFEDTSLDVTRAALECVIDTDRAEEARLLIPFLRDPRFARLFAEDIKLLTGAIDKLIMVAPPEALPPLVELLDHPHLHVRTVAQRGLRGIKKALDEKAEWKRVVEGMKKSGEEPVEKKE